MLSTRRRELEQLISKAARVSVASVPACLSACLSIIVIYGET